MINVGGRADAHIHLRSRAIEQDAARIVSARRKWSEALRLRRGVRRARSVWQTADRILFADIQPTSAESQAVGFVQIAGECESLATAQNGDLSRGRLGDDDVA